MYTALNKRKVKGALIDAYALGSQKKLFNNDQLRLSRMLDHQSSYGVVMAGEARKLEICFREYLKYEKVSVYEIISNNVESVEVSLRKLLLFIFTLYSLYFFLYLTLFMLLPSPSPSS